MSDLFESKRKRKPVPYTVKIDVYSRVKGKCERCGKKLKPTQGDFHHTRDPSVTPTVKTVEFQCPTCHRIHGHFGRRREWKDCLKQKASE